MRVKELKLKQKRREERKEDYMQMPGAGETRSGNWKNLSRSIEFFLLLCYINRYLKNMQLEFSSMYVDKVRKPERSGLNMEIQKSPVYIYSNWSHENGDQNPSGRGGVCRKEESQSSWLTGE